MRVFKKQNQNQHVMMAAVFMWLSYHCELINFVYTQELAFVQKMVKMIGCEEGRLVESRKTFCDRSKTEKLAKAEIVVIVALVVVSVVYAYRRAINASFFLHFWLKNFADINW